MSDYYDPETQDILAEHLGEPVKISGVAFGDVPLARLEGELAVRYSSYGLVVNGQRSGGYVAIQGSSWQPFDDYEDTKMRVEALDGRLIAQLEINN